MLGLGLGLAGISVALMLWVLGHPWTRVFGSEAYRSRRFWWPWVLALEPLCARLATWRMRRTFERWRGCSGLADDWRVAHWLAARCLLAVVGAILLAVGGAVASAPAGWLIPAGLLGGSCGFCWPQIWLQRRVSQRRLCMMRELPFMLDLLTLCVEAGLSLPSALLQVSRHAPDGPLRRTLADAAALERTGVTRAQWLARWADVVDVPGVRSLVLTLAQADRLGMGLGPLLRAQAAQQRNERFLRAEALALEAPVRMLFPMVLCIFPCTFLVIGFPLVVKFLQSGF